MSLARQELACQKQKLFAPVGARGALWGVTAPFVVTSVPASTAPRPLGRECLWFWWRWDQGAWQILGGSACPCRYLLEDFCRRLVRAVEYHIELLALLHLLQQRPGILVPRGQLADFDFDVVPGRGFDELLQANQTWGMTGNDTITIPATSIYWQSHRVSHTPHSLRIIAGSIFATFLANIIKAFHSHVYTWLLSILEGVFNWLTTGYVCIDVIQYKHTVVCLT